MNAKQRIVRWSLIACVLLAAAALAAWWLRPAALPVEVAEVRRAPFVQSFVEEGRTRLEHRYLVAAPVGGMLRRVVLREGDTVRAGQVVAEVEPSVAALNDPAQRARLRADTDAAGEAEDAAHHALQAADAALRLARSDLKRLQGMRTVVAPSELDAATTRAEEATQRREAAQAELAAATQRHAAYERLLALEGRGGGEALALTAPIDGVVIHRYQESAVPVAVGQAILEIGDPHDLEIEVQALSADAVKLRPGMRAIVHEWGGEGNLEARVALIEPGAFTKVSALGVEEQRTYVRLDFTSPYAQWARLGDGYRVEVEFVLSEGSDVLQVPSGALVRDGTRWTVFALRDGRARAVPVEIGRRGTDATEIRAGLRAGERIVAWPDDRIAEGTRVRALPGGAGTRGP
ncbi:MAG: HlyD family efflux transporter periplasmic adaptor subunit [Mizugakiibacter sp.]|uniref:efflux RND transporter periplasmic adaptor subunit n=1 Tax=Mizugakiibacter sp. TaxID=1972610 RepID=UPI0031C3B2D5|nr:HlyD family efflux transporter periplasmic adaptor subunit [Xanthomonadaceae bacterium]